MNIYSTAPMTYAQAALGGEIHISTVDGDVCIRSETRNTDRHTYPSERKRCSISEKQKCPW